MTDPKRNVAHKMVLLAASLALFATACGGDAGPSSEESSAATAAATSNQVAL